MQCVADMVSSLFFLEFRQWEVYTYPTSHKKMQACTNALLSILMVEQKLKDS